MMSNEGGSKRKKISVEGECSFGTLGKGKKTYLFLSGLKVQEAFRLRSGVELLPIRNRRRFRTVVLSDPNIYNRAFYVLLENNIRSQLVIRSTDPKSEAINAWNAQWDAILLGALFNCEIIANIQSDRSFDRVVESAEMHLTNPFMHGNALPPYLLKSQDVDWLKKYYCKAHALLGDATNVYSVAVHAMATYRWHTLPRVQLAILWSGIEALFVDVKAELSFRLAMCIALFLSGEDKKRAVQMYDEVRALYKDRSSAVHGSELKTKKKNPVSESAQLLLKLIRKCAETGALPKEKELLFGADKVCQQGQTPVTQ